MNRGLMYDSKICLTSLTLLSSLPLESLSLVSGSRPVIDNKRFSRADASLLESGVTQDSSSSSLSVFANFARAMRRLASMSRSCRICAVTDSSLKNVWRSSRTAVEPASQNDCFCASSAAVECTSPVSLHVYGVWVLKA